MYKLTLGCGHITNKYTGQAEYSRISRVKDNNELRFIYKRNYYSECEICGRQLITKMEYMKL